MPSERTSSVQLVVSAVGGFARGLCSRRGIGGRKGKGFSAHLLVSAVEEVLVAGDLDEETVTALVHTAVALQLLRPKAVDMLRKLLVWKLRQPASPFALSIPLHSLGFRDYMCLCPSH